MGGVYAKHLPPPATSIIDKTTYKTADKAIDKTAEKTADTTIDLQNQLGVDSYPL